MRNIERWQGECTNYNLHFHLMHSAVPCRAVHCEVIAKQKITHIYLFLSINWFYHISLLHVMHHVANCNWRWSKNTEQIKYKCPNMVGKCIVCLICIQVLQQIRLNCLQMFQFRESNCRWTPLIGRSLYGFVGMHHMLSHPYNIDILWDHYPLIRSTIF